MRRRRGLDITVAIVTVVVVLVAMVIAQSTSITIACKPMVIDLMLSFYGMKVIQVILYRDMVMMMI